MTAQTMRTPFRKRSSPTLAWYVSRRILLSMLGMTALLVVLQMLFSYIGQIPDFKGEYGASEALQLVWQRLPITIVDMLPLGTLLGAVMGLGTLATTSELIIMRAAGQSVWQITRWVLRPALVLALLMLALNEWAVPRSYEQSENLRREARGVHVVAEIIGYWHRDGNQFAHVSRARADGVLEQTRIYQFDPQRQLLQVQTGAQGRFVQRGRWQLEQVNVLTLQPDGRLTRQQQAATPWRVNIEPRFLHMATADPEYLAPSRLYNMAQYSQRQGQSGGVYWLNFWQKMLSPLAVLAMTLVACAFIFGPLRSQSLGFRVVIALFTGLLFRYIQDFMGYAGLVYHAPILLMVLLPIGLTLLAGAYVLRRVS